MAAEDRILYFDCFSGISGDMAVAALLDLGVDGEELRRQLQGLNLPGVVIDFRETSKGGIRAKQFLVNCEEDVHTHRTIRDIYEIIDGAHLDDRPAELSKGIFLTLAQAEAAVHGTEVGEIRFHEVGGLDSIVDIVGFSICFHLLAPSRVLSSPVNLGCGTVRCRHGVFPVPAPAVAELARGLPVYSDAVPPRELTTPTGMAILKTVCRDFGPLPVITPERVGYGAGGGDGHIPNVLRVFMGMTAVREEVVVLETNVDDMSPQLLGYVFDRLLSAGALDVYVTNVFMKKNRPAQMISVICRRHDAAGLENILFRETTTIGIRKTACERRTLPREIHTVVTPWGEIRVKVARVDGGLLKYIPEYEDCRAAAVRTGRPLREICEEVARLAAERLERGSDQERS